MRISEFEEAIENIGCNITMDEMKIHHSTVEQACGHIGDIYIYWDQWGRSFTADTKSRRIQFVCPSEDGTWTGTEGILYQRDATFDLKF